MNIPRALALIAALAIVGAIVLANVVPNPPEGEIKFGAIERIEELSPEEQQRLRQWYIQERARRQLTSA